jgi:hypothetical protein
VSTSLFVREIYDSPAARDRAFRDAINRLLRDTMSGATAQRPAQPVVAQRYYDTDLGIPIWWNGSVWKNAAGATV